MSKVKKKRALEIKDCTTIQNCSFIGLQFDPKAVETISLIAQGVVENTKVLMALAQVLKASNVTIEAMIHIENKKGDTQP